MQLSPSKSIHIRSLKGIEIEKKYLTRLNNYLKRKFHENNFDFFHLKKKNNYYTSLENI